MGISFKSSIILHINHQVLRNHRPRKKTTPRLLQDFLGQSKIACLNTASRLLNHHFKITSRTSQLHLTNFKLNSSTVLLDYFTRINKRLLHYINTISIILWKYFRNTYNLLQDYFEASVRLLQDHLMINSLLTLWTFIPLWKVNNFHTLFSCRGWEIRWIIEFIFDIKETNVKMYISRT